MAILDKITEIEEAIEDAYDAVEALGGTVPSNPCLNNLPTAIGTIPDVSGVTATAPDVLSGKKFVTSGGVLTDGTMTEQGALGTITLDKTTTSYNVPSGHVSSGTVQIVTEQKSATPTKSTQTIDPTSGKVITQFTVNPIPSAYQDVTEVDASATDVLSGKKIVNSSGTVVTGSMTNQGTVTATIDGLNTTSYTIPQGYHSGSGTVSLTSDIETALSNI